MKALLPEALLDLPLEGTALIEASAGTGKTYTIANLYLRHVAAGREPRDILVVTFTNAATEELRGRIRLRLHDALAFLRGETQGDDFLEGLAKRVPERLAERLALALQSMDEAGIYTIHGFCQRALQEFSFLSGQPFDMEIGEDEPIRLEAMADWWRKTFYPLGALEVGFRESALGGFDGFREAFNELDRPLPPVLDPPPPPLGEVEEECRRLETALRSLARAWEEHGAELQALLLSHPGLKRNGPYQKGRLEKALRELDVFFHAPRLDAVPEKMVILTPGKFQENLKGGDPPGEPFFEACEAFLQELRDLERALAPAHLADALARIRCDAAKAKRRLGLRTFDDLLVDLDRALDRAPALAERLALRFPVAMVDEFQDTDAIQYRIFRRIYEGREGSALTLIGDPKQAIYSFRNADLFTYLQAKERIPPNCRWTLVTNWRSTPELIAAVNRFFSKEHAFLFKDIPFVEAQPAPGKKHRPLVRDDQPPVTVWRLPRGEGGKSLPLDKARERVARAVAREIAALLREARLGEMPLKAGDLAVLVRTSDEGGLVKRALGEVGIRAVLISRESVWRSVEAEGLLQLLEAVAAPEDRRTVRRALASPVLGLSLEEIAHRLQDEGSWTAWVEALEEARDIWLGQGFMPAFLRLLRRIDLPEHLPRTPAPERRLTNLMHLAELIQQASRTRAGIDACLAWVRRTMEEALAEAHELRLENDERLVRISTIHASKGLQYPVVFVPFPFSCRPREAGKLLLWHDEQGNLKATFHPKEGEPAFIEAERERLAEDVRLLYVALTRAESALYLAFGMAGTRKGHAGRTALAWLLSGEDDPDGHPFEIKELDDGWEERLASPGLIRVIPLPEDGESFFAQEQVEPPSLAPAPFGRKFATAWKVHSFTAMAQGLPRPPSLLQGGEGLPPALAYPAGPHVGAFLHSMLERLDFTSSLDEQVEALATRFAPRFGLDAETALKGLIPWLEDVVHTPLGKGFCLADISRERQLRELSFDFATGDVDPEALEVLLGSMKPKGRRPPLNVERFHGLVTGVIDLVFEHGGRYWIADFKSDLLGHRFEDYVPRRLHQEMRDRRYDLQYALYTLALHRYLKVRLGDYRYQSHFGGVFYLFLRGMRPEDGPKRGVFFARPSFKAMKKLDRECFSHG